MLDTILQSLYFFLPAYVANMTPVFLKKVHFLAIPISEKRLGKNKTWRGVIGATLVGGIIFYLQKLLYLQGFTSIALIDYADFSLALGFLLGAGAIVGDMIKSYYKRKAGIVPGKAWIPFDQLDFVIGALTLGFAIYVPPASVMLTLMLLSPLLHIATNHLGYWLGIRNVKF